MARISASPAAPDSRGRRSLPRRGAGGTLLGIFIGLVLGLALAASVAFYVTGGFRAYQAQAAAKEAREGREPAKSARAEGERPRFDFYKILPGNEEPKVQPKGGDKPPEKAPDRLVAERAADKSAGRNTEAEAKPAQKAPDSAQRENVASVDSAKAAAGDRFWLQAGSFSTESDAENLKARLALSGWEASVQQGLLADKSVRYRVRLGPYDNTDELNRIKSELGRRGFDVAVIKY